jgi:hypothetical protein
VPALASAGAGCLGGEDRSEGVGEGGVPVAHQEPELLDAVRQVHEEGTGLLGDRFPGWVGRNAEDVDPASGDLQHEPHLQALAQDGLSWKKSQAKIPRPGRPGTAARSGWRGVVPGRCRIV